jgi:aspartyl-tRNA(Asn)/glutamyl-tRNA(Gln) amidotransferase subunit A
MDTPVARSRQRRIPLNRAMADELPWQTLTELARKLARRENSSREIVAACLENIDSRDPKLHAFVDVWREDALAQADLLDRERREGRIRTALHGLPIALKDLLHVEGRQTTAGSKSWRGRISDHTATAVTRLVAAGMIPLGKTHMVEFAFGGWGCNPPMGAPWNPWDANTHRVAGGSSSGSAVAVAAGLAPAAIGSDTGGSIRIPSSLCGLTGLKPTYGLVSLYGAVPLSTTLDSIGPLARSAEDAALLVAAMAGPDPRDPATLTAPAVGFAAGLSPHRGLRGLRITALPSGLLPSELSPDIARAMSDALAVLRDLGATVMEEEVPLDFDEVRHANGQIIAAEAWAMHRAYIEDEALDIDPAVRRRVIAGKDITASDYRELLARRQAAMKGFADWMRGRTALATPTLPITAVPVADVDEASVLPAMFTRAANYLGACALSLPAGLSTAGLPIGLQLVGAPFTDASLVRIGREFQAVTSWHLRRPDLLVAVGPTS